MKSFVTCAVALLLLCSLAVAAKHRIHVGRSAPAPAPTNPAWNDIAKQVRATMDPTQDPCEDFYQFSCGGWEASYELPPDRSSYSLSSTGISEANDEVLQQILEDPSGKWPVITPFYDACMDLDAIEHAGADPLLGALSAIPSKLDNATVVMGVLGELHSRGIGCLFQPYVMADSFNPTKTQLHLDQGGIGLYTPGDYEDAEVVAEYEAYIASMFELIGESSSDAANIAKQVLNIEDILAKSSYSPTARRDPYLLVNPTTPADLASSTFGLGGESGWNAYFAARNLPTVSDPKWSSNGEEKAINVAVPPFLYDVDLLVSSLVRDYASLDLYQYMRWCVMNNAAPMLSSAFADANFAFYGTFMNGQTEQAPRSRTCVQATDKYLGELLGRYYVAEKFSAAARDEAEMIIHSIEAAFLSILPTIDWMDNSTRKLAAEKLGMISNLVGYPDHWRDYTSLCVGDSYYTNVREAVALLVGNNVGNLFKDVNPLLWQMTPPTVNAYYDPTKNQMVIPAGILQSPFFFDLNYPMAMNFGGIGNVVGHEAAHGFDDQGSQYDGTGKLHQWWPQNVTDAFEQQAMCVSELYSQVEVLPGLYINGNLTLGENIADMAGVELAHQAYKGWVAKNGEEERLIPELTNEQLHFVTYALTWCEVDTDEKLRQQIQGNPHSPAKARTNVPLSQYRGFAKAFNCPANAPMNPPDNKICRVW